MKYNSGTKVLQNSAWSERPAGKHMGSSAFPWLQWLNQAMQKVGCKTIPSGFVLNKNKPLYLYLSSRPSHGEHENSAGLNPHVRPQKDPNPGQTWWCECVVCRWDVSTGRPQVLLKFRTIFIKAQEGDQLSPHF